jgi:hypothetical protein
VVVTDELRAACAEVAERARHVRIDVGSVKRYAASLPVAGPVAGALLEDPAARERTAWYWLTLDAINFGSGWFPTLSKGAGGTGYSTIADGVRRRFDQEGPWSAAELQILTAADLAVVTGQAPDHELLGLFATALNDVGARLAEEFGGSPLALVDSAGESALALVETLAGWSSFEDVSTYDELRLPFLKRAQILATDLERAGVAQWSDRGKLTVFADNLVPHVLRLDGVLSFDRRLVTKIELGELLEHGAGSEVEIRACTVHAVELVAAASPRPVTAAALDQLLWNRGQGRDYKARPRHRSRTTAY